LNIFEYHRIIVIGNNGSLHKKYPDKPFFVIESGRKMKKLLSQWKPIAIKRV
jgi:hypothetical protein